jgi:hypothetical protein
MRLSRFLIHAVVGRPSRLAAALYAAYSSAKSLSITLVLRFCSATLPFGRPAFFAIGAPTRSIIAMWIFIVNSNNIRWQTCSVYYLNIQ